MIKKTKVRDGKNGSLYVSDGFYGNRHKIVVLDNNEDILLSDIIEKKHKINAWTLNHLFVVNYTVDNFGYDNYIINVESVYDINNHRLLDLSNSKVKSAIEHMLFKKESFSLAHILQEINEVDLQILNDDEKTELNDYLTSGNKKLDHNRVVNYLLSYFPEFKEYDSINHPLTVTEYRNIAKALKKETFELPTITQNLAFLERESSPVYGHFSDERRKEIRDNLAEAEAEELQFRYDGDVLTRKRIK